VSLYHKEARVTDLSIDHEVISARVLGTETYRVRLSCTNNRLTYKCTCPFGEDGNFCKHCVAVGLAWLEQPVDKPTSKSSLESFLENMDHQQLVKLVLNEASRNRRLRDKLEFAEASSVPAGPNLSVFRKAITNATRTAGVDYYSMPRFARRLLDVIESIRGLLQTGHATAVVELTEYAFTRLEKAIGTVDDSDGHFREIIPELTELHHAASKLAHENPWQTRGHDSTLVEIFLWENNYDDAWEEAIAGGCFAYLWLELADRIAPEKPERAYSVYRELMGPTVNQTNNTSYADAITLLKKMRKLASRLNCESEFSDYLTALRVEYKRKRNFIQMLDTIRQ